MRRFARSIYHRLRPLRAPNVNKLDFQHSYSALVKSLKRDHDINKAMEMAVGGDFEGVGTLEVETLKYFGLKEDSYLIDVGCGSGRLAKPLAGYLTGQYLGIDIVPDLLEHARRIVGRPDWKFETAKGLTIPEKDEAADVVCFFSVFTHLLHEQTYVYLQEAKRVLKPNGKIVFSFLDFSISDHWGIFEFNIRDIGINSHPLNIFIGKEAISVWAEHLGLQVLAIEDSDKRFIPLQKPVSFDAGGVMEEFGFFGQSVCALQKEG